MDQGGQSPEGQRSDGSAALRATARRAGVNHPACFDKLLRFLRQLLFETVIPTRRNTPSYGQQDGGMQSKPNFPLDRALGLKVRRANTAHRRAETTPENKRDLLIRAGPVSIASSEAFVPSCSDVEHLRRFQQPQAAQREAEQTQGQSIIGNPRDRHRVEASPHDLELASFRDDLVVELAGRIQIK